jgi:hypothetical protein
VRKVITRVRGGVSQCETCAVDCQATDGVCQNETVIEGLIAEGNDAVTPPLPGGTLGQFYAPVFLNPPIDLLVITEIAAGPLAPKAKRAPIRPLFTKSPKHATI